MDPTFVLSWFGWRVTPERWSRHTAFRVVCVLLVLLMGCGWGASSAAALDLLPWVSSNLAAERGELGRLKDQLGKLGPLPLGQTVSQVGAQRLMTTTPPPESPWIQLDLGESQAFDSVTIVPAILSFDAAQPGAYAFPPEFRVDASDSPDFEFFEPLFDSDDGPVEAYGGLPLVIETPKTKARYLRLTVTRLANVTQRWTFAFSEIMVLRGNRNVALGATVKMSRSSQLHPVWHSDYLIDGRTPLGPPTAPRSVGDQLPVFDGIFNFVSPSSLPNWILIDLGEAFPVDEIRLHPVHARQGADFPGYSFPQRFRIEGSMEEDFAEPISVFDTGDTDFSNPGNNSVTLLVPNIELRYLRIVCVKSSNVPSTKFGFAEAEVYSGEQNVALGKRVVLSNPKNERPPSLLVDGEASYGKIVELPQWINRWQQARVLRGQIRATENRVQELTRAAEGRLRWLAAFVLAAGVLATVMVVLIQSRRRYLEQRAFRMRLAEDLHDEIGSNLAAIARIGEVAEMEKSLSQVQTDWRSVRELALECGESMRETLWLLGGAARKVDHLGLRLQKIANRMLPNVAIQWRGKDWQDLSSDDEVLQRELVLTFKEAVANIARNSKATEVSIELNHVDDSYQIRVVDNGVGFDSGAWNRGGAKRGMGLRSMTERMKKAGGSVSIESNVGQGTQVVIGLPKAARKE